MDNLYKWNPITDEMRKANDFDGLDGFPMTDCEVWITIEHHYCGAVVCMARLRTGDYTVDGGYEFNWHDLFTDDVIASIKDKTVTAWKHLYVPRPYEKEDNMND